MRTKTHIVFSTCSALLLCIAGGGLAGAQDRPTTEPQTGPQTEPQTMPPPEQQAEPQAEPTAEPQAVPHIQPQDAEPVPTVPPPPVATPASYDDRGQNRRSRGFLDEYGLSLSVGGGVMGFTNKTMRDTTSTGGLWEARVGVLTNKWLGAEVAYQGGLQNIDALGLNSNARLLSTSLEADARVNFVQGRWGVQPYAFAGVGWTRYELNNVKTNTSDVNSQDDTVEIPLGVGFGMRSAGFLVDLRGSYRPTFDNELVPTNNTGDHAAMHSWQAALRLGYAW